MFTCEVIFNSEKDLLHEATGYEGNAILTKYDFIGTKGIIVKCYHEIGNLPKLLLSTKNIKKLA